MAAAASPRVGAAGLRRSSGVAACLAAAIASAGVTARGPWPWLVAFAAALIALGVLTVRAPRRAPSRTIVFCTVMFVLYAAGGLWQWPPAITTVLVCSLPLLVLLLGRRGPARQVTPWLTVGRRPDVTVLLLAPITVVLAAVALVAWTVSARPDPGPFLAGVAGSPLWLALLGVVAFALVNPIWEELLFRGVLLEDLSHTWSPAAAVAGQAVVFGLAHWSGFPSGWIGMTMAAVWGAALGVIRLRTGGIVLPYLVHVTANIAIGLLAVLLLA